ncbi:putative methyltransferase NSUN7 isoform X1 [Ictalurus punctatus]|uniref:Methyltransferase NSUN7 isoform X1 n=1 Tax=Ictalurus punctatus TaxID=7998 RepID=A0A2D0S8J1_ICTPU|nr:putative methyltransferase NSUN7 isoform X1 [Ictalurus punctatus]
MVKQVAPRRVLSRSFRHSSRTELSSPLTPWTSPSPPTLCHDPSSVPRWNPSSIPDHVYLDAASIFQNSHQDKAATHRLISYGKRSKVTALKIKDEAWQHRAYELAFNTLKYQELLEDIMIDSSFYLSKPVPDDLMSLVAVMLYDLQDRKFLPRERPANQDKQEEVAQVREVENCLLRFKTKLAASLARCRIKHDLLSIDCMLPESIRQRQERGSNLPMYAWINTLRTSMQDVCEVLKAAGFSHVKSITQLEGQTFCEDLHCLDLLVFPTCAKRELHKTNLLKDRRLVIQDKACCVGPWALRPLLVPDGDVLMAGSFSAATVAHTAAIVAAAHTHLHTFSHSSKQARSSMRVFVCVGECSSAQRDEMQEVLGSMGCSNVKLLPEALHTLDVYDTCLQKVQLILLTPQCSLSAVSNPVDYLLRENGDKELLQDLSQGSVSQSRLHTLVTEQKRDLHQALHFPKVRVVVYSTCSSLPAENEEVVKSALTLTEHDNSKLQPFKLSHPSLLCCYKEDGNGEKKADFFRLEASDQSNGCFLAVLTSQPEPEVTPQEVIARATASGLLDGIQLTQPIKKEGRGRQTRKGPAYQSRRQPHVSVSSQSQVAEFLNRELKANSSVPTAAQERTNSTHLPWGKSKPTHPQHSCKPASSKTSTFSNPSQASFFTGPTSTLSSTTGLTLSYTSQASSSNTAHTFSTTDPILLNTDSASSINGLTITAFTKGHAPSHRILNRTNGRRAPGPVAPPSAPPRGRHEVLRPVLISFPPPQFPSLCLESAPVKIKTPLLYQNWRNCSRPAPLTHTRFGSSIRPWL